MSEQQPTPDDAQMTLDWYVNELAQTQNRLARAEVSAVGLRRRVQALETILAASKES